MGWQKAMAEIKSTLWMVDPIYKSKSEMKPDNFETQKSDHNPDHHVEPEMSRNRAMDELQNCRSGDGRHQIGAMNAFPDRKAQNCT